MDTNANNIANAAQRLLERIAAYRTPEDWPQPMREAIAELKAEVLPPDPLEVAGGVKLGPETPACKFPDLWYCGEFDEPGAGLEKFVNKHVYLALADVAENGGAVAGLDDGRATITFLLDDSGYNMKVVDVEEAFICHGENVDDGEDGNRALAETFQRLADRFRKKAEECE